MLCMGARVCVWPGCVSIKVKMKQNDLKAIASDF